METPFVFGPVQKLWLHNLKTFPERQNKYLLGDGTLENYTSCCLGELLVCNAIVNDLPIPFVNGIIVDGMDKIKINSYEDGVLSNSFKELGLFNSEGRINNITLIIKSDETSLEYDTLVNANDEMATWPQIAAFVEQHPESVFTKSF